MIDKLEKKYTNILTEVDGPIIEKMKEDICYCALDFEGIKRRKKFRLSITRWN